jgi:hypothetical protein
MKFRAGDRVKHKLLGLGTVKNAGNHYSAVAFDNGGLVFVNVFMNRVLEVANEI